MNRKIRKKILGCMLALFAAVTLTACGEEKPKSYDGFSVPAKTESSLKPVDSLYVKDAAGYPEEGTKEEVLETIASEDGLCTIQIYPDYYDVLLDYENGNRREVGKAYAKTIRRACPEFESIVEPYVYESIRNAFSGQEIQYEKVEERMNVLAASIPEEYREELEILSEELSGGKHGFVEDGKLSYEEVMIVQMVPDALRETACSALSLWGDKTVSGERMTLRVLEWRLGSENQMCRLSAVTHMKNGTKSYTSIGMLGLLDTLTAVNDDGVFMGILDVGTVKDNPFVYEGKMCYTYAIKYALETFDNAEDAGNYMVENSGDFTWCHNVIITDKEHAYCAEDCVKEVQEKKEGYSILRDENTPLHKELHWDNKDSLCVVNSFASAGSQDDFTASASNTVRFQKYNDWVMEKEKFSMADVKDMITKEQTDQLLVENVHGTGTVHLVLVDYATGNIQVAFTGKDGVEDKPVFLDVGHY